MNSKAVLLAAAFGLAGLSAVVHLLLGVDGLVDAIRTGSPLLIPLAFIFVAGLVFALIAAFVGGVIAPQPLYATGAVLMFLHLFAYADVHALGFFESATGADVHEHDHNGHGDHGHDDDDGHSHDDGHGHDDGGHGHDDGHGDDGHSHDDGHDHSHDGPAHEVVLEHLADDLTALTTKLAETVSATAFLALYVLEREQ